MGSLGDVSRGLSLVAPLKAAFPDCRIVWLIEPKCLDIVQLAEGIDRIVLFERGKGLRAIIKLFKELRSEQYDICLDLQRHFKSGFFSRLSGAKRIIGFHRNDSKEFNWLFSSETISEMPDNLPKIEHYWEFLKCIGVENHKSAKVKLKLIEKTDLGQQLKVDLSVPYLVINMGSAWESKDWDLDKYFYTLRDLARHKPDYKFLLCGAGSHKEFAAELEKKLEEFQGSFINLCAKTSLAELVSLIAYSKLVFGPDSGPGHLASMLEVPFVGVFGPTDTDRTAPYGDKVALLTAQVLCRPCYKRKCPGLGQICMKLIDTKDVSSAILKSLQEGKSCAL